MKKIVLAGLITLLLMSQHSSAENTEQNNLAFSDTLSCNRVSIVFNLTIWRERTDEDPHAIPDEGVPLSDWGNEGSFSGDTYTVYVEKVDALHRRYIYDISITLNSEHTRILSAEYHRTIDDEDVEDAYELSQYFKASDIPYLSGSASRLTFRVNGMEVCNKIEEYKYQHIQSVAYKTIDSIDHCEEDSALTIEFTCQGIVTTTTAPLTTTTTSIPSDTTTSTSISSTTTSCDPEKEEVCGNGCCNKLYERCCEDIRCCLHPEEECCYGDCCRVDESCDDESKSCIWIYDPRCITSDLYGENAWKIELLRNFRDKVLSQSPVGQEVIRFYYEWSPVIVKAMKEDEEFKAEVKRMIDGVLEVIGE